MALEEVTFLNFKGLFFDGTRTGGPEAFFWFVLFLFLLGLEFLEFAGGFGPSEKSEMVECPESGTKSSSLPSSVDGREMPSNASSMASSSKRSLWIGSEVSSPDALVVAIECSVVVGVEAGGAAEVGEEDAGVLVPVLGGIARSFC